MCSRLEASWLRVATAAGRAETRCPPDTLVSAAAGRLGRVDIHPFHRRRYGPYLRHGQISLEILPATGGRFRASAPQSADRIPGRRRAAQSSGVLRGAAGRVHGHAPHRHRSPSGPSRSRKEAEGALPASQAEAQEDPGALVGADQDGARHLDGRRGVGARARGRRPEPGRRARHRPGRRRADDQFRRHRNRVGAVGADRERQPAAQERPAVDAAPAGASGEVRRRHRHRHEVAISSRPATSRRRSRIWSRASPRPTARRCCSASPAPARPSPWPR